MKLLPLEFRKNGCHYYQLNRTGDVAMYQLRYTQNSKVIGYEVFIIQRHNGFIMHGKPVEPCEYCPSNEQFGSKGFSYDTAEKAYTQYNKLVSEQTDSHRSAHSVSATISEPTQG